MYNNILVTATNSAYYESLLTLISGVHQYSFDIVDKIFVYNLGLDVNEIKTLNSLKNVEVLEFPENSTELHPKFMEPKSYVYKIYCMYNSSKLGSVVFFVPASGTIETPVAPPPTDNSSNCFLVAIYNSLIVLYYLYFKFLQ